MTLQLQIPPQNNPSLHSCEDEQTSDFLDSSKNKSCSFSPIQRAYLIQQEMIPSSSPGRNPVSTRAYNRKDYEYIISFPRSPTKLSHEDALLQRKFYKYGMGYDMSSNLFRESSSLANSIKQLTLHDGEVVLGTHISSEIEQKCLTIEVEQISSASAARLHEMEVNAESSTGLLSETRSSEKFPADYDVLKNRTQHKVSDIKLSKVHPYEIGLVEIQIMEASTTSLVKEEGPNLEDSNMPVILGTSINDRCSDSNEKPNATAGGSYTRSRALPSLKEEAYMTVFERRRRRKTGEECNDFPEVSRMQIKNGIIHMPRPKKEELKGVTEESMLSPNGQDKIAALEQLYVTKSSNSKLESKEINDARISTSDEAYASTNGMLKPKKSMCSRVWRLE